MNAVISKDYYLILASLSMNQQFADDFFANPEEFLSAYELSEQEKETLLNLSQERYAIYKETQNRTKDCDSCCNGSSMCFAACCQ